VFIVLSLTRINKLPLMIHCSLIEHIESTPDTIISLSTGEKVLVLEPADEVVLRVVEHHRSYLDWHRPLPVRYTPLEN
jgi:flagellar protein FlbD